MVVEKLNNNGLVHIKREMWEYDEEAKRKMEKTVKTGIRIYTLLNNEYLSKKKKKRTSFMKMERKLTKKKKTEERIDY